jgi:2-furoyl-CoA dehydrogenase large subunit
MLRVEDDALLRGEGRFLDDLAPVARTFHAAVVRSQLAHARIDVDATAALAAPGVVGVLTGADVAELSRPFPAGIETGVRQYAAAIDTARYVGEPIAVVVARDRYLAEDAAELVDVDYDPLEAALDPVAAAAAAVHDRSFAYGDVDGAMAEADLVLRQTFHFPRFTCTPVECYAVVADWDATAGRLTAWANFQGPFTLHGVAAAALGLKGDRFRLLTPPDSGGSFGIKSSVFAYVVLMGLAARKLGVPVTWIEDRLEHLAASAAATGRTTEVEAGFRADGRLVALRYDAIEDVGAYVRAPEPATLYRMHGSLSGAYTVPNVAARNRVVLTNTIPSGLNRGFGGPQLYLGLERTMAIAARRLGLDPAELARRNLIPAAAMPYRTPSGALYDSGDYEASLEHALELADYDALQARVAALRGEGRLAGIGLACIVEPSISNMGYITLALTADERAQSLPKSGNAEGASIAIDPHGGITVRLASTPQGQGHRTVCAQVVADVLGCAPEAVTVMSEMDTASVPWTVASGNYSSRFSGVAVGAVQAAALKLRAKIDAIRAHAGDESLSLRRVAGMAHWNPEGLPDGEEPGLAAVAFWAPPTLDPPDAEDRVASSAAHGFIVDICAVEVDRATGEVSVLDYVTVHDAGRLLNPLLADGQVLGGFAHGVAAALYERHVYDEWGNLMTASLVDYLAPTAPDIPALRIGHCSSTSPVTALGAKGIGEGNTMSAPVCIANAVADAIGRDDVELPLTPPRVWELLQAGEQE